MTTTHAARYGASEFLKDRHPDLNPPFPVDVIPEEISIAYGRRHVPKLVDVIGLADDRLPDPERARALRYLLSLLTNQETKSEAVSYGAAPYLVHLLSNSDPYVRQLTSQTLMSLADLMSGRAAVVEADGIPALTHALKDPSTEAREAASQCLEVVSSGPSGEAALLASPARVLFEIVAMLEDAISSSRAVLAGVGTLCNCTTSDQGIFVALDAQVPPTILKLAKAKDSDADLKTACARCLRNLCHHPYGKVQVHEADGIPVLTEMLTSPIESIQQQAAAAFMGLTLEEDAKLPTIHSAAKQLVAILHHENPDVAENVLATIQNACEHPEARRLVELLLTEIDMDYVFGF